MSVNQIHELVLEGCTPIPLAGYLKALGVLRLLGEQKPEWAVRGAWREDRFVLKSAVFSGDVNADRQLVRSFFLDEYRPTPIVAPWNGRGGFLEGEEDEDGEDEESVRAGALMVRTFSAEDVAHRFEGFKKSLLAIGDVDLLKQLNSVRTTWKNLKRKADSKKKAKASLSDAEKDELKKADERVKSLKATLLQALRNQMPAESLAWFDACQILSERPRHAPLLGRGGLDGSMDFGVNFMQRLSGLIDTKTGCPTALAAQSIPASLFGDPVPALLTASVGQFSPGGAGGPNAGTGFDAESLVNPWDFVLTLEGALLFAASATKRLEAQGASELSYPFTVLPVGSGSGGASITDEKPAGAKRNPYEIWLPLWERFSGLSEVRTLLTEGRATVGRRPARDGLGFIRAVAGLGVDRGVASFQRYGFLMRSGKAFLATPLSRVEVRRNPDADLIDELESGQFLDRLRRFARDDQAPPRIRSQVRQLEDALFELAQRPHPRMLQNVISHLGVLSLLLGKSPKGREAVPRPLPGLSESWVLKADDGSTEFRIAAALAGLHGSTSLRPFLVPVEQDKYGGWVWNPESRIAVWGEGGFAANLGHVIARRRLEAERLGWEGSPFQFSAEVTSSDVAAWLAGQLDEVRLTELLLGLIHARIPRHLASRGDATTLPAAYGVLKPFFTPPSLLAHLNLLPPDRSLSLPGELVAKLQAGRAQEAVDLAWRRLRAVGFPLPTSPRQAPSAQRLDGPRLLTALAIPLEAAELAHCLSAFTRKPSLETA